MSLTVNAKGLRPSFYIYLILASVVLCVYVLLHAKQRLLRFNNTLFFLVMRERTEEMPKNREDATRSKCYYRTKSTEKKQSHQRHLSITSTYSANKNTNKGQRHTATEKKSKRKFQKHSRINNHLQRIHFLLRQIHTQHFE